MPNMCSQPQEEPVAEALSESLLRFVGGEGEIAQLRGGLGHFSHRCRNLLNGMKMSLYLVRRGPAGTLPPWWVDIEQSYMGIEELFEKLQRIYRPMPLTTVTSAMPSSSQAIWARVCDRLSRFCSCGIRSASAT